MVISSKIMFYGDFPIRCCLYAKHVGKKKKLIKKVCRRGKSGKKKPYFFFFFAAI